MTKMVFWHGWAMSPVVWNHLIESLSESLDNNTEFSAVPLPGYAENSLGQDLSISSWIDNQIKAVNSPIVLCGWSMGAIMALVAASRYPEKIKKLVLFGATPCFINQHDWQNGLQEAVALQFRTGVNRKTTATVKRFIALFNQNDMHAKEIVRELSSLAVPPLSVLLQGLDFLHKADLRDDIPRIHQSTLIIHGRNDPLMPVSAAEWLAQKMPEASLKVIEKTSHAPFLSNVAQCAGFIQEFLQS